MPNNTSLVSESTINISVIRQIDLVAIILFLFFCRQAFISSVFCFKAFWILVYYLGTEKNDRGLFAAVELVKVHRDACHN